MNLITLAEHYGIPEDEKIKDTVWLRLVGTKGYIAFAKDTKIRHNKEEAAALKKYAVRCFSLPAGNLGAEEMAGRFLHNLPAITKACQRPGPFFYAVYKNEIRLKKVHA